MDEAQYSDNTLYIEGCKIVRNKVKATNGTARGVIYTDGDKLTIVNSIIANNTVEHASNARVGAR